MSDLIRLLPNHVAHQIAAGEVVQRPASVVKELLENALDAEAQSIHLILQDAGKSLIKVIDDGRGMSISDASMSFLRFATSKIKTTDDFFRIRTMGFRGEALSAIAAVCQVEMQTRRKEDEIGISILLDGNEFKGENFVRSSKGTSITVKNIFYNVPERRKYLKSNKVELRKIMEEFHRLTLAHPKVRFRLYHKKNNKLKKYLDFPPVALRHRIIGIFGKNTMISIDEQAKGIHLKGFIVNPSYSKKTVGEQFIFVNKRFIKSSSMSKTVLKALKGLIPYGTHPSYFLFFFLDPKSIDVNIHPTKNEIRFEDEASIYRILYTSIKRALANYTIPAPNLKLYASYNPLFSFNEGFDPMLSTKKLYEHIQQSTNNVCKNEPFTFQLCKRYIISTRRSELIIIDQHRAHKRIYYEYFIKNIFHNKNATSQQLQFPMSLSFSSIQLSLIKKIKNYLVAMGFAIKFDEGRLIVEATPVEMNQHQVNNFFHTILGNITEDRSSYQEILASSIACSIAIKHGRSLSIEDMNHIIYELFYLCTEPNYTPSGKKVFITLNSNFINKKFHECPTYHQH